MGDYINMASDISKASRSNLSYSTTKDVVDLFCHQLQYLASNSSRSALPDDLHPGITKNVDEQLPAIPNNPIYPQYDIWKNSNSNKITSNDSFFSSERGFGSTVGNYDNAFHPQFPNSTSQFSQQILDSRNANETNDVYEQFLNLLQALKGNHKAKDPLEILQRGGTMRERERNVSNGNNCNYGIPQPNSYERMNDASAPFISSQQQGFQYNNYQEHSRYLNELKLQLNASKATQFGHLVCEKSILPGKSTEHDEATGMSTFERSRLDKRKSANLMEKCMFSECHQNCMPFPYVPQKSLPSVPTETMANIDKRYRNFSPHNKTLSDVSTTSTKPESEANTSMSLSFFPSAQLPSVSLTPSTVGGNSLSVTNKEHDEGASHSNYYGVHSSTKTNANCQNIKCERFTSKDRKISSSYLPSTQQEEPDVAAAAILSNLKKNVKLRANNFSNSAQYTLIINVPPPTTRQDLLTCFEPYGQIEMATVVCDSRYRYPHKEWTATAGYAFIRFANREDAQRLLDEQNSIKIRGCRVRATWARKDSYAKQEKEVLPKIPGSVVTNHPDFICNLCSNLVQDPVVTPCGHMHCYDCLTRWMDENHYEDKNICPNCSKKFFKSETTRLTGEETGPLSTLYRILSNLEVICPRECGWRGPYSKYTKHHATVHSN